MAVKVKICGMTNPQDAAAAAEAGADLIGMIFYEKSPRAVMMDAARAIARAVPPWVVKVGVFVNPAEDLVREAIAMGDLNMLQFHGEETPGFCRQFGLLSMKAFRMRDEGILSRLQEYPTDAWLLDAYSPGRAGGTGETFNWDLAVRAAAFGRPIFLAGGLTPENVEQAIRQVNPWGVDVASGVEERPGVKDHARMRAFIAAARNI
jgi:phosphoribosylanthranilate isomerase